MRGQGRALLPARRRAPGFSLIELMIAMLLGLLLTSAIFELFLANGRMQAMQSGLARLQENGRIAMGVLTADLQQAGRLPCGSLTRPEVNVESLSLGAGFSYDVKTADNLVAAGATMAVSSFFATAGVRSRPASAQSSTIPASQSPAADPDGPGIAHADRDTLDLQLD